VPSASATAVAGCLLRADPVYELGDELVVGGVVTTVGLARK
jgi:hypothetical protein